MNVPGADYTQLLQDYAPIWPWQRSKGFSSLHSSTFHALAPISMPLPPHAGQDTSSLWQGWTDRDRPPLTHDAESVDVRGLLHAVDGKCLGCGVGNGAQGAAQAAEQGAD